MDLDESAAVAARSEAVCGWFVDSIRADIDLLTGRPAEAAAGYLQSLEAAAARGDQLQVSFDLHGVAAALSAGGRHADGLEVSGSAAGHDEHFGRGGDPLAGDPVLAPPIDAARAALGPEAAAGALARGRAVPEARRLAHARAVAGRG